MPKLHRFKSVDLRRNQLMDQWKIVIRKNNLLPVPSDEEVRKIRETFDDMVFRLGKEDGWKQLKIRYKDDLEKAYYGKRPRRSVQTKLEEFFGDIAKLLDLSHKETAQRVWADEKLDNFIDMYKNTLQKHIFPLCDKPEVIKEKFVNGLNHTLRNEFHQLQKRYGRGFWDEVGAAGTSPERSQELSEVLEFFYEEVADSMGIDMADVIDLIWEGKAPPPSCTGARPENTPLATAGDRQWSFQYVDNLPDETDDDEETVVGHSDDTGASILNM